MSILLWPDNPQSSIARADLDVDENRQRGDVLVYGDVLELDRLARNVKAAGYDAHRDALPPLSPLALKISAPDDATAQRWVEKISSDSAYSSFKRLYINEYDGDLVLEGGLSMRQWQALESQLVEDDINVERVSNHYQRDIVRIRFDDVGNMSSLVERTNHLLQEQGVVSESGQQEMVTANPIKRTKENITQWRRENPARSAGVSYLIASMGQFLSGLARGNVGEMFSGLFYSLSNVDLALGRRGMRKAEKIVEDALEDFRHGGQIDFDKSEGFTPGAKMLGAMPADYMNWRERPGNEISSKAYLALAAGASAAVGAWRGNKTILLDEKGDAILGADGLPQYHAVKDPALLYDGSVAFAAYLPQVLAPSPRYNYPAQFDPTALMRNLSDNALIEQLGETAPGQKVRALGEYIHNDPTNVTGRMMASRNVLHMGYAAYDFFAGLPQKHLSYENKRTTDALRQLTDSGAESSLYPVISETLGVDKLVTIEGKATDEAIQAADGVIASFEATQSEFAALLSPRKGLLGMFSGGRATADPARVAELQEQLAENESAYRQALFVKSFDPDNRTYHTGIPFINRTRHPSAAEKMIALHEAGLNDPYRPHEPGGMEEQLYIGALNRTFADEVSGSRKLPLMRFFYAAVNYFGGMELARVNSAPVAPEHERNQAVRQLDRFALVECAAEAIRTNLADKSQDENALVRAAKNMAKKLEMERECKSANLDFNLLEAGILNALDVAPQPDVAVGW